MKNSNGTGRIVNLLAIACALSLASLLPSGLVQMTFGRWAYARDVFVAITWAIGVLLWGYGYLKQFPAFYLVYILLTAVLVGVIGLEPGWALSSLVVVKWLIYWCAALFVGGRLYMSYGARSIAFMMLVVIVYSSIETAVGAWELKTGQYYLQIASSDLTALGFQVGMSQVLEGNIRVRGLQRDVFQYANLMGLAAVCSLSMGLVLKRTYLKFAFLVLAVPFIYLLFRSGGRSAILGLMFAATFAAWPLVKNIAPWLRIEAYSAAIWALVIGVTIYGIAPIVSDAVTILKIDSYVTNLDSSYIRDENWDDRMGDTFSSMDRAFVGAAIVKRNLAICDNMLVWNLYHLGLVGTLVWILASVGSSRLFSESRDLIWPGLLLTGFIIGEGLARESYFFYSSIAYFLVMGAASAARVNLPKRGTGGPEAMKIGVRGAVRDRAYSVLQ